MYCTTLNRIRANYPCESGWKKLLKHLGKTHADDELLPMTTIIESNGLDDALWCLRSVPEFDRLHRCYAVWCARQVQHLMTDQRILDALDVAERYAYRLATREELSAAWEAAGAAAWGGAAGGAAWEAAWAATRAARAIAWEAAWEAARAATRAATRAAARAAQKTMLIRVCSAPSMDEAVEILKADMRKEGK